MYRDDHGAARARVEAQIARQEQAAVAIRERVAAIDVLLEQLAKRDLPGATRPQIDLAIGARGRLDGLDLAGLVGAAADEEARADVLERELENVSRLFALLNKRAQGKSEGILPLAPAPRAVPLRYALVEVFGAAWSFLAAGIFFPPLWVVPLIHPAAALAMLALVGGIVALKARKRIALLRWGIPVDVEVVGTRSSGSEYTNWPIRVARGWTVTRESFTGDGERALVSYLGTDGARHELVVGQIGYTGGVILADTRRPDVALGIEEFTAPPQPDHRGVWTGEITFGAALKSVLVAAYLVGSVWAAFALDLFS